MTTPRTQLNGAKSSSIDTQRWRAGGFVDEAARRREPGRAVRQRHRPGRRRELHIVVVHERPAWNGPLSDLLVRPVRSNPRAGAPHGPADLITTGTRERGGVIGRLFGTSSGAVDSQRREPVCEVLSTASRSIRIPDSWDGEESFAAPPRRFEVRFGMLLPGRPRLHSPPYQNCRIGLRLRHEIEQSRTQMPKSRPTLTISPVLASGSSIGVTRSEPPRALAASR